MHGIIQNDRSRSERCVTPAEWLSRMRKALAGIISENGFPGMLLLEPKFCKEEQ